MRSSLTHVNDLHKVDPASVSQTRAVPRDGQKEFNCMRATLRSSNSSFTNGAKQIRWRDGKHVPHGPCS